MTEIGNVPVDAITKPWWDATRERRLLLQSCATCHSVQHHPRALCTACGGTDLGWVQASGAGTVDAFTVVHRAPDARDTPYVVARVRLAEGPILLSNIAGPGDDLTVGAAVALGWAPLPDGRNLPVFLTQQGS